MKGKENVISEMTFCKENLQYLLCEMYKNQNVFTHVEFVNWCGQFWSKWRSDENDMFNKTDEKTINTVFAIIDFYIDKKLDHFDSDKIKSWLDSLNSSYSE